jgi:hypothetical protein
LNGGDVLTKLAQPELKMRFEFHGEDAIHVVRRRRFSFAEKPWHHVLKQRDSLVGQHDEILRRKTGEIVFERGRFSNPHAAQRWKFEKESDTDAG